MSASGKRGVPRRRKKPSQNGAERDSTKRLRGGPASELGGPVFIFGDGEGINNEDAQEIYIPSIKIKEKE
jgi:hypothetical protein